MSTEIVKPDIPEIGEAERAAHRLNAMRCSLYAGEDITDDQIDDALAELASAECVSNRDALALLAYARFLHQTGTNIMQDDAPLAARLIDGGQFLVSRALAYLERDTGVSAWDFLEPEHRAKIQ